MTIETLKSPNPRNWNSISVIKSKFLSVSSVWTLCSPFWKLLTRDVMSYRQADCTTDFLGDTSPPAPTPLTPGLGQIFQFFNAVPGKLTKNSFYSLMKIKWFEILFITLQEHFVIKVQSTNQTIAERCSFFEVQMCMKYIYFFLCFTREETSLQRRTQFPPYSIFWDPFLNWPYGPSAKAVYATQTVLFVNLT